MGRILWLNLQSSGHSRTAAVRKLVILVSAVASSFCIALAQTPERPLTSFPYTPGLDVNAMDKSAEPYPAAARVAVNVSAIQLRHRDFVAVVREALREGVDPPAVDIEITESVIMGHLAATVDKLRAVRDMGLDIAIDDFGSGYSSLGYVS
jgi:hypothetical protein